MQVLCTDCNHEVPNGTLGRCPNCGGILRPEYSSENLKSLRTIQPGRGIDRYRPVLPVEQAIPFLGEGDTPLIPSKRLGAALGLKHLYFKNEGLNPTGAFKDRAGAMVAALALEAGAKGVLTASSGNASSAISAYCAAAGLPCAILMEPGNPTAKLRQTIATGAQVLLVEGVFAHGPDGLADFLMHVAERTGYYLGFVWAPINPYILEGIKTISYEIASALAPAQRSNLTVIGQVGGGDMFAAQWRGWKELQQAGVIEQLPRMIGVQSLSAPPLLKAFETGSERVATLPYANSKVSGINVPFTGEHALQAARESGGAVVGVSDDTIFEMQRRVATEEGIWIEPAGAAPLAILADLLARKLVDPDAPIVCIMSGAGFKDTSLASQQVQNIALLDPIKFDVEAVTEALGNPQALV